MADSPKDESEQPSLFGSSTPTPSFDSFSLSRRYGWQYNALNALIALFFAFFLFLVYTAVSPYFAPKPKKEIVQVQLPNGVQIDILNGSGISGIGMKIKKQLIDKKIDVIDISNFPTDVNESFVIDRAGNKEHAKNFALILGIDSAKIVTQISNDYMNDLSLVVGKDYQRFFQPTTTEQK